ncbi:MAG: hypothetical protein ABFD69_06875 [Candidatus Sumerlaeia bacterium]
MKRLHFCAGALIFALMCSQALAQAASQFSYNFEPVSFLRMPGGALNSLEGKNGQAVIKGNRLYVLDGVGYSQTSDFVHGFDISDPAAPRLLFSCQLPNDYYKAMYVNNGYAILSRISGANILVRLDDANPTTQTTTIPAEILGQSDSILVVNDTPGRVQFWDITNPAAAYKISSKSAPIPVQYPTVGGSVLYIKDFVYDFSDVHNPKKIEANISADYYLIMGSTGYYYDNTYNLLVIDDLSNPVSPRRLGTYVLGEIQEYNNAGIETSLVIDGSLAFFLNINADLYAFDLSNPGSPDFVRGYRRIPNIYGAIVGQNSLVYLFDSMNQTLAVYRYTGPRPGLVHGASLVNTSSPASIQTGKSGTASVTLRNSGSSAWGGTLGYDLNVNSDPGNIVAGTSQHIAIPDGVTVQPGQQYTFQVPLLGPATTGHYTVQLQMIHQFVTKFGPVVSFDIDVVSAGNSVQNWALFD